MKSRTHDERFIIALYLATEKSLEEDYDRYQIGHSIGMQERGVNATCKLLLQANFIKKSDEEHIYITDQGTALARRLLEEI